MALSYNDLIEFAETVNSLFGGECLSLKEMEHKLVHKFCVFGKDGRMIQKGETVYGEDGKEWYVTEINPDEKYAVTALSPRCTVKKELRPEWLSHYYPFNAKIYMRCDECLNLHRVGLQQLISEESFTCPYCGLELRIDKQQPPWRKNER